MMYLYIPNHYMKWDMRPEPMSHHTLFLLDQANTDDQGNSSSYFLKRFWNKKYVYLVEKCG